MAREGEALSDEEVAFIHEALVRSKSEYTERGLKTFLEWELRATVRATGKTFTLDVVPTTGRVNAEWTLHIDRETGQVTVGESAAIEAPAPEAAQAPPDRPPCTVTSTSSLPGATIRFSSPRCVFSLAEAKAGLTIPYVVELKAPVAGVTTHAQDAGRCGHPGPSRLIVFEKLAGSGQEYCQCDRGLCGRRVVEVDLRPGEFPGAFSWTGVNWRGPSDYGAPLGRPFPAGVYTLTVSSKGKLRAGGATRAFLVTSTIDITLTP